MREIKFRAWEKNLKEIIPVHSIDFEKKMINTESAWRFFNEIELMQYTGLKDKNGKEIYEGDILHAFEDGHYGGEYYAPVEWVDYENEGKQWAFFGTVCMKVKEIKHNNPNVNTLFTLGYMTRRYGSCIELSEMTSRNYSIQVVGNIYENHELLGVKESDDFLPLF